MSWFHLALISVFALASAELTQQHLLNTAKTVSPKTSGTLTFSVQSILCLFFLLVFNQSSLGQFQVILANWQYPLIVALLVNVAMVWYLKSFQVKNISISTVLLSSSVLVTTALGILFLGETTSILKFLGIFLVLSALVFINLNKANLEKNHLYGLAAGWLFGIAYTLDKLVVVKTSPLVYFSTSVTLVSIFGLITGYKTIVADLRQANTATIKKIIFSACCYFIYNMATFVAYSQRGEVGRIDAINNSQVFLILLFEFFILRNTKGFATRLLAAAIAFTGVYILGTF